jgi:acylphosphatase
MSDFDNSSENGGDFGSDAIVTLHLSITGRVQGVGYRDSMRLVTQALGVTGWVRNRADGSVEAVVQGTERDVERVVAWCHNGPPGANVKYVNTTIEQDTKEYIAFSRVPTA